MQFSEVYTTAVELGVALKQVGFVTYYGIVVPLACVVKAGYCSVLSNPWVQSQLSVVLAPSLISTLKCSGY